LENKTVNIDFFGKTRRGEKNNFYRTKYFFTGGRGGKEKIFFLDQEFFYRKTVSKFFLGAKDFLQGGKEVSKVVFA
jgi:hypothetical protein